MKKFCKAIIFLIILAVINSDKICGEPDQSSISKKNCLALTSKEEIGTYCCYLEIKAKKEDAEYSKKCLKVKEDEMEILKAEIEGIKETGDAKFDCGTTSESDSNSDSNSDSYYIQIKILLFVLVLL